jgi:hypothetical protein
MNVDLKGPWPDITPAQITAVVGALITLAAAFGLPLSGAEREALTNLATVVFPVLVAADALIRHGRNRQLTAEPAPAADELPLANPVPDGSDAVFAAQANGSGNGHAPAPAGILG